MAWQGGFDADGAYHGERDDWDDIQRLASESRGEYTGEKDPDSPDLLSERGYGGEVQWGEGEYAWWSELTVYVETLEEANQMAQDLAQQEGVGAVEVLYDDGRDLWFTEVDYYVDRDDTE